MTTGERALAMWPLLASEVLIFGTAIFVLLIAPAGDSDEAMAEALAPLWRGLATLAFVISPIVLLVDAAAMANVALVQTIPVIPEVMLGTHLGRTWLWSFPVTAILAAVAWRPGGHRLKSAALALLAGTLLLAGSLSSHAIDHGALAVAIYFIHEAAAALWVGAILGLWLEVARGTRGPDWMRRTCPRVSRVAGWAVVVLILSGLYTAYLALGLDPDRLIYAAYGRILVVKVCAAGLVLLIGAYNRYWLIPTIAKPSSQAALLRNVGLESALLIGVIGLAALLANTPPAH